MKKFLFLLLLFPLSVGLSSNISGGGSSLIGDLTEAGACTDDHFIRWDDGGGTFQCEAAPGAAGGDAWGDAVDADILPTGADDTYDLGSASAQFKDGFFDGTLEADVLTHAGVAVPTISSSDTLTNKSIDSDNNTITNIVDADVKAAAAIAVNKLAALTASEAVVTDGSGFLVSSTGVSATEIGYLSTLSSDVQTQLNGKSPSDGDGIIDQICGHIETPSNKTYWPVLNSKYPFTVNEITTDVDSGTISMQLEIDGTPVTGCSTADVAVTTTESTDTCSAANVLTVGKDLTIVTTSNSSSDDLRFCIKLTRD